MKSAAKLVFRTNNVLQLCYILLITKWFSCDPYAFTQFIRDERAFCFTQLQAFPSMCV